MKTTAVRLEKIEYSIHEQKILNEIDVGIDDGDFVVLVGANGSGKSTLLKILNGMLKPDFGCAQIYGENIVGLSAHQVARNVATLTQDLQHSTFSDLTVSMNIALALDRNGSINHVDKKNYLATFNDTLKDRSHVLAGHLSGGQRQALALAMCFAQAPKVLLLDEHTSALDPKASDALMQRTNEHVCEKKLTTIMITHSLEQALQFGNRLIAMKEGRIVADIGALEKSTLTKKDLIALAY